MICQLQEKLNEIEAMLEQEKDNRSMQRYPFLL